MQHNDTPGQQLLYRIDSEGRLTHLGEGWDRFARENKGDKVLREKILGSSLWDHLTGSEVKLIYRQLVEKVERTGRPVWVMIQCDAPALRRKIRITIRSGRAGSIEFLSKTLAAEERAPVELLDAAVPRSDGLIRMCSYCKAIESAGHLEVAASTGESEAREVWLPTEEAVRALALFEQPAFPEITHTVCPSCYESLMSELDEDDL